METNSACKRNAESNAATAAPPAAKQNLSATSFESNSRVKWYTSSDIQEPFIKCGLHQYQRWCEELSAGTGEDGDEFVCPCSSITHGHDDRPYAEIRDTQWCYWVSPAETEQEVQLMLTNPRDAMLDRGLYNRVSPRLRYIFCNYRKAI